MALAQGSVTVGRQRMVGTVPLNPTWRRRGVVVVAALNQSVWLVVVYVLATWRTARFRLLTLWAIVLWPLVAVEALGV